MFHHFGAMTVVTLDAAEETHTLTQDTTKKKHGTFSSTTTRTRTEVSDTQLVGTAISGAQGVQIVAGRDVNAVAAKVYSGEGAVTVVAERDVNLLAGQESYTAVQDASKKKSGVVSNARANSHSEIQTTTAVGTILSGETVGILAGRDINVVGSTVASDIDTTLMAERDVMITSAQDTMHQSNSHYSKSSGLTGGYGGGVLSAGYSSSKSSSQGTLDAVAQVASSVLSLEGNTTIKAGNTLTVKASDLGAGQDLTLIAKDIQLLAQQDTTEERNSQKSKSSGFSVGLTLNPAEAYQSARDSATNNMPEGGSAMTQVSRTAEGIASGTRAATTSVVVQAGSQRSQSQDNLSVSTARTSNLVAGNNLTLLATDGSITSQGAQLSAEGDALLLAKQNILLDVAHNIEAQSGDSNASGWSLANNTTGLPVGQFNNQGNGQGATDTIIGTQLSVGGTTTMISQEGDITLTAANLVSEGDTHISAARHLTIQSGQDRVFNENHGDNQAIGTVVLSDTERFVGYHTEKHNDNSTRVTQVASNVGSLNGNVSLNAGGTYTQTASNVLAGRDISVTAREIQLLTADNIGSQHVDDESLKIGVFGRVSSPLIDLVNNADAVRHSDGRLQAMHGMAAVAGGYQAYNAVSQGNLASVEAGIGFATSESRLDGSYQAAQGSTMGAGGNLILTTTEGDIHVVQGNLKAGNILSLDSANNILLEAGQSHVSEKGSSHYSGAEVGVGASVGAQTGVYVYAQASAGSSKSDTQSTTYQNTQLAADNINLSSRGDTTLRGADGHADSIDAAIGGKLTIESLQDTQTQMAKSSEVGGRVQVSIGTAWSVASGNASGSSVEGDYMSVNQQSGLFAGDGGYRVNAGTTELKGGIITSTDAAEAANRNSFTTGTLTVTDLANHADYNGSAYSVGGSIGGSLGDNAGSNASSSNASINKTIGVAQDEGHQSSATRSGINTANITITDVTGQAATGKSADQIKAEVATTTSTDTVVRDSGALANDFDALAKQYELQTEAGLMQTLDGVQQDVRYSINASIDEARQRKDAAQEALNADPDLTPQQKGELIATALDAQQDIERLQKAGVLVSVIAGGLTSPADSVMGIAAGSLAPVVSYQIGQFYKDNAVRNDVDGGNRPEEGSATHVLTHALLGGLVAGAGGDSALLGALAAGGAEAVAPTIAKYLYGKDANELTAAEKQTIGSIVGIGGALLGGLQDDVSNLITSSNAAQNAANNNWGEVGHYSTMATILYLAGFSEQDAKAVALAAWAPDTDERNAISAPNVANAEDPNSPQQYNHLLNAKTAEEVSVQQKYWTAQAAGILAVLKQYENNPQAKAAVLSNPEVQRALHALGDSFAHVTPDGGGFEPGRGHFWQSIVGPDPDNPYTHKDAFVNYSLAIYEAATTGPDGGESARRDVAYIRGLAEKVASYPDEHRQGVVLDNSVTAITGQWHSGLVESPVEDCGGRSNCPSRPSGSLVNPIIWDIYSGGVMKLPGPVAPPTSRWPVRPNQ